MNILRITNSEDNLFNQRGFQFLNKIGEGSYANVYLAKYRKEGHKACKIIDTSIASISFVTKFLPRELDILLQINHPHIVYVHSIFQRKKKYFIFMRLAENGSLLNYVKSNGIVSEDQARIWHRQISLALQYLHVQGIAHRDVKCENILITSNFYAKLCDFGFARYIYDIEGNVLLSNTFCGSIYYTAPEIIRGKPYIATMADVWSLGVALYVMLNRAVPFKQKKPKMLYNHQINRKWKFRLKVQNTLSDSVKEVVTKMLEPDVKKRWKIEQVLNSKWMSEVPALLSLSSAEQHALNAAYEKRRELELDKKHNKDIKEVSFNKMNPLISKQKSVSTTKTKEKSLKQIVKESARLAAVDETDSITALKDPLDFVSQVYSEYTQNGSEEEFLSNDMKNNPNKMNTHVQTNE